MIKVGIVGANGYTGFELLRILGRHPHAEVRIAASRSNAGTPVAAMYPALAPIYGDMPFADTDPDALCRCDVCFTALPHAASAELGGRLYDAGVRVIDLSADFRYDSLPLYERTYGVKHPRPELNEIAVYGLPELFRDKIRPARIVGNPGCYTTASILALYPLIKEGVVSPDGIIIDAKSGVTGAGRKADVGYNFCETAENFKAYGVTTHRHTTEIEEKLGVTLSFTPHLLPIKRGILATIYAGCTADAATIQAAYDKYYKGEPFVAASPALPEVKWVRGSNCCRIGYIPDKRLGRVIVISVIDNLIKGASGQAVQNMNIMFGLDETEGLDPMGEYL